MTHRNVVSNVCQCTSWFTGAQYERKDGAWDLIMPADVDPKDIPLPRDEGAALVVVPWFHAMGTVIYLSNMVSLGLTMVVFPRFDPVEYLTAATKYKAVMLGGAPQLYIPLIKPARL